MRRTVIVLVLLTLCGCASSSGPGSEPAALSMAEAKAIVLADRARTWKDPDSIRDAKIAPPESCFPWTACICIEMNARNSFGGYTGLKQHVANMRGRSINNWREAGGIDKCSPMEPFPEMNGSQPQAQPPRR